MSLSVQAFMLPISVRIFGFTPLPGPLMSVVMAMPVVSLLYGGFIYIVAGHFCSSITSIPLNILSSLADGLVSRGAEISKPVIISSDFDVLLYLPGLIICAAAFRAGSYRKKLSILGLIMIAFSFYPVMKCEGGGEVEPISYPAHGGTLYGGNGGILVLKHCPTAWSASRLVREIRRSGARGIDLLVVLDPWESKSEGILFLILDLAPKRVLVSPWRAGSGSVPVEYVAVRSDTVLAAGRDRLALHAPAVMPEPGVIAGREETSLTISPLD
jgi:hypothetical protein